MAFPMIGCVEFRNFKILRDTTLPLSPFTLIIGPNGSGKSTAVQALQVAGGQVGLDFQSAATAGIDATLGVELIVRCAAPNENTALRMRWTSGRAERDFPGSALDDANALFVKRQATQSQLVPATADRLSRPQWVWRCPTSRRGTAAGSTGRSRKPPGWKRCGRHARPMATAIGLAGLAALASFAVIPARRRRG